MPEVARRTCPFIPGPAAARSREQDDTRDSEQTARVSITQRDREALDLVASRRFGESFVVSLDFEMQVRRLTLVLYGRVLGGSATYLARLTFFGTAGFGVENEGAFPESVRVSDLALAYADEDESGSAELSGVQAWTLSWSFDGLAYEEHPAVLASLADEL